jgi:hypothetical protein
MKITNTDCQMKWTESSVRDCLFPEKVIMKHDEKGTAGVCMFEQ